MGVLRVTSVEKLYMYTKHRILTFPMHDACTLVVLMDHKKRTS